MNISYKWLKDYLDMELSTEELADKLTFSGIEVESVKAVGEQLEQVVIAEIVEKKKHPNADKLSICLVSDGKEEKQVICGAPNCRIEQKVALAPVGAAIGDFRVKKAKLRGELSYGMLCSEKELEISEDHNGIMELPENAPAGTNLASYLNLQDTVYEVEITPNRPDLLGIFGIARDLSALLNIPLKSPVIDIKEENKKIEESISIENAEPELCTRYTARVIENITIKESPDWLKQKLTAIGLRPISNVVDITNFVMMEFGHPLHAFDYDKVKGRKIVIRRAKKGEKIDALDDRIYELDDSDLVIADKSDPIALAGVIGAKNSHITSQTKNIVLESANFLYSSIRRTSGRLKIFTDSAYRFERDISDETAENASKRAAQLIVELTGGKLLNGKLDSFPNPKKPKIVKLRPSRTEKILTISLTEQKIISYLESLGLKLESKEADELYFQIPAYRKDLTREIDLIEEIIRLHGYNKVKTIQKPGKIMDKRKFYARRKVQNKLIDQGFLEIVNWSFGDPQDLNKLELPEADYRRNLITLKNPLGSSFSIMRSSLIPDLLKTAHYNFNHNTRDLKLFELSKIYLKSSDNELSDEKYMIDGLLSGNLKPIFWKEKQAKIDFFDVKGIVFDILQTIGLEEIEIRNSQEKYFQPGMAIDILFQDRVLGNLGKLDAKIGRKYDLESPVFLFELMLDRILDLQPERIPTVREIPKFPSIQRDLSFVVSNEFSYRELKKMIRAVNPEIIQEVILYDEYTGKNIKKERRSLTFTIKFNSSERTLTDEYINGLQKEIIKRLEDKFKIEMR